MQTCEEHTVADTCTDEVVGVALAVHRARRRIGAAGSDIVEQLPGEDALGCGEVEGDTVSKQPFVASSRAF